MAKAELTGIGAWRLGESLGQGERAVVYRAQSPSGLASEAHERAVKVLHGVLAHDQAVVAAFAERAELHAHLTRLEHPAIVACHAVESAGGRPFSVLELVDGVSLDRLFPERGRAKFSLEAAGNLVATVLDALAAAANEKIVHGRLSANDVLVQSDGTVTVTGFGQRGDLRMDFLAVHRLAQSLGAPWTPEVDAWLDALVAERPPYKDARAARAAFPLAVEEAGRKALERAVKNRRRKDERLREQALAAAEEESAEEELEPEGEPPADKRAGRSRGRMAGSPGERREEAEAALRQARIVALSALAIVIGALAVAVFTNG